MTKKMIQMRGEYYLAIANEYAPVGFIESEKIFVSNYFPEKKDFEGLVCYDKLGDAEVIVYKVDTNFNFKKLTSYFYRKMPEFSKEFEVNKLDVSPYASGDYWMEAKINGVYNTKRVSKDIYLRFLSDAYDRKEFVLLFAPEFLE